jgi:hypothetical protein
MKSIFVIIALFFCFQAEASLNVQCKTSEENVTAEIQFKGAKGQIFVKKAGVLAYFNYLEATYSEKWKSVTVNATQSNGEVLNGVKIYFDMHRGSTTSAIRPYGLTTEKLFPGSEGIVVYGMTCDQDYNAIIKEISN